MSEESKRTYVWITQDFYTTVTYLDLEEMHHDLVPAATELQIGDSLRMRKGRLFCVKEFHETRT